MRRSSGIMARRELEKLSLILLLLPYVVHTDYVGKMYTQRDDLVHYVVTKIPWALKNSSGIMHCASTCGIYEGCTFLAINSKTLECHVFKEDGTTWSTERKIDHGWLYYEEYNLQIQFLIDSLVCGTDGYVTIDSHCFKVHEEERSYGNASAICFLEGGRMAVTDNAATFLALNDYIREHHGGMVGYLLGLTDRAVEGEWRWENGNLIGTVPEFNGNQPNGNDRRYNDFTADCAYASVVWHDLHKAIDKLYDDNCDHPATFVCERVIV